MDVTRTLPSTSDMWQTYARGSHMNQVQMGNHRYWYQPGVYLFRLGVFDTKRLKDGVYRLVATAWDTAGNRSSTAQVINVHNRKIGWADPSNRRPVGWDPAQAPSSSP